MYQIWANDEVLLYDSTIDDYKIAAGSGVLETNKAGSFTFTLFPDHFYYHQFIKKRTVITVRKSGRILFRGRVINDKVDYWKRKTLICEGELNFLRDTEPYLYSNGINPRNYIGNTVRLHNSNVDDLRKFAIGRTTVGDRYFKYSNVGVGDNLEAISKNLLEADGGYLTINHGDDDTEVMPTLNYLADITDIASQPIVFGVNLRDFVKTGTGQGIYTAVCPLCVTGDMLDGGTVLGIEDVNDGVGYVCDETAMETYGYICKNVYFDDITDPTTLKNLALDLLAELVKEEITVTLTALDLHMLDRSIESYGVNQYIRCVSPPHDFAETLLCYKQTFDLLRPQNDTIVLGGTCRSLTGSITKMAASGGKVDMSDVNNKISGLQNSVSTMGNNVSKAQADILTNAGNIQKLNVKTDEYKTAEQQMNNLLAKSFGVFHTAEAQADGSTIHYLHDKPTLAGSTTIWKMASDAFMVSTDGGNSYRAGMDSSGNALVNILSAIGINASWIDCDNLSSLSANLGGWLIDNTKIYKEIEHPGDSEIRYRVYFKPPVQSTDAVTTEIITCEISTDSGFTWTDLLVLDADGVATFHSEDKGTYKIHGSFMELIDVDGVQVARIGTQNRVNKEIYEEIVEEVAAVSDEIIEEEPPEEEIFEEILEEIVEKEYDNDYIPEFVLTEDSSDKAQAVLNPSFLQFGDRSAANKAYIRRDENGCYVLRVDRIEVKDKNSNRMAYIEYVNGEYMLKVDYIAADRIDANEVYARDNFDTSGKYGAPGYWGYTGWVNDMHFVGGLLVE